MSTAVIDFSVVALLSAISSCGKTPQRDKAGLCRLLVLFYVFLLEKTSVAALTAVPFIARYREFTRRREM